MLKWYWETNTEEEIENLCNRFEVQKLDSANQQLKQKMISKLESMKNEETANKFQNNVWLARMKAMRAAMNTLNALDQLYGVCGSYLV